MPETFAKYNGSWVELGANNVFAKVGEVWKVVERLSANDGGSWTDAYVRDTVGPGIATNLKCYWWYGTLKIEWTNPSDADFSHARVTVYPGNEPYTQSLIVDGTPGQSKTLTISEYIKYNVVYTIRIDTYDTNGNAGPIAYDASMQFTGSARGRVEETTSFLPIDERTWRSGLGFLEESRPRQGSSINGQHTGAYYYGDQIYDSIRGARVDAAGIEIARLNRSGAGGEITPEMWYGTYGSVASGEPDRVIGLGQMLGANLCRNGDCPIYTTTPLPANWRSEMTDHLTSARLRSIVFYSNDTTLRPELGNVSSSYMIYYSRGERPFGPWLLPGKITVQHSG